MSNHIQSPPEICASPTLRMILNRIDGLPDAPASRISIGPTTLMDTPSGASKIKVLDNAHWDLAARHLASWQGSLPDMHGPNSRLAVAFGGGFVIPLLLGLSFVTSMISGPPLAAKATQGRETVTDVVELQLKRVQAFASPDFFESAWTALPVPTQIPAREMNRVEVVNGVVSPIAQIRVAVSTEPPVAPPAAHMRNAATAALVKVAKPPVKAPAAVQFQKPAVAAAPPAPSVPPRQAGPRLDARKTPLPVAPGVAVANTAPPRIKALPSAPNAGESWASSWHRSALGMTQQKP